MKIFRRLRFKALKKKKTWKYFSHVAGEVVLIVIGIFLGLKLNKINDTRIEANQTDELLLKFSKELKYNIDESEKVIDWYQNRNILLRDLVVVDSIDLKTYKQRDMAPTVYNLLAEWEHAFVKTDYLNKVLLKEEIIEQQHSILVPLLRNYIDRLSREEKELNQLMKNAQSNQNYLLETQEWFYRGDIVDDDEKDELFANSIFKNRLHYTRIRFTYNYLPKIKSRQAAEIELLFRLSEIFEEDVKSESFLHLFNTISPNEFKLKDCHFKKDKIDHLYFYSFGIPHIIYNQSDENIEISPYYDDKNKYLPFKVKSNTFEILGNEYGKMRVYKIQSKEDCYVLYINNHNGYILIE